jgi:hypothetical protein
VVGKPEYTPPELLGCDFRLVNRTANHDNFALAVLIFLMLMEGRHPFAARWEGEGMPPPIEKNIHDGVFPYTPRWSHLQPAYALPLDILPWRLRWLMRWCFVVTHRSFLGLQRPGALTWKRALEKTESQLISCQKNPAHKYSRHLKDRCPWCMRKDQGLPDPFPAQPTRHLDSDVPPASAKQSVAALWPLALLVPILGLLGAIVFFFVRFGSFFSLFWEQPLVTFILIGLALACILFRWYKNPIAWSFMALYALEIYLFQKYLSNFVYNAPIALFPVYFFLPPLILLILILVILFSLPRTED